MMSDIWKRAFFIRIDCGVVKEGVRRVGGSLEVNGAIKSDV